MHKRAPAISTMLAIVGVIFLVELAVMTALGMLGHAAASIRVGILDAALLSLLSAPVIYKLVLVPATREQESRVRAEVQAEALGRLAMTDSLTSLLNRRGIEAALNEAIAQAERYDHPLSVALADVDRFKAVNDRHGHAVGDQVPQHIADILSEGSRAPDKVGRYGGEEFLLVLPEADLESTRGVVERLRAAVENTEFEVGQGQIVDLTVSIGATELRWGEDLRELLARVDQAMYDAKRAGRNLVASR